MVVKISLGYWNICWRVAGRRAMEKERIQFLLKAAHLTVKEAHLAVKVAHLALKSAHLTANVPDQPLEDVR
jgi:hypothetical protein